MNKKPPELHIFDGTKSKKRDMATIPNEIKNRIPAAEYMDNPDAWDKQKFVRDTSEFLFQVYGIGTDQDKHTLSMLADHMETYIMCQKAVKAKGYITVFNDGKTVGPNPFVSLRNKETTLIIQLCNELGLNPRNRLASGKSEAESPFTKFMQGPLAS